MLKTFWKNIPGVWFWVANIVFWMFLTCMATENTYQQMVEKGRLASWFIIWWKYIPWWMLWALVAPFVVAASKSITFKSGHLVSFIFKNIAVAVLFMGTYWLLTILLSIAIEYDGLTLANWISAYQVWARSLLHIDLIVYLAVLSLGYTISYYQSSKDEQLRNEKLARQLVQVELKALKAQINPHFLFNTLNTIASLIRLDRKSLAVSALTELSSMLRKVLEQQASPLTTVEQEIDFINSYLAIQQMRFENKLDVQLDIDPACLTCDIPFMLLQPLVENAVQHGSQLESDNNLLSLTVSQYFNRLKVELVNKVQEKSEHKGFGIGIKNCRERLDKIYQGKFTLSLQPLDNDYFKTTLLIPLGDEHD